MKKILCLFLLIVCFPVSSRADGFLKESESFQLARVTKFGDGGADGVISTAVQMGAGAENETRCPTGSVYRKKRTGKWEAGCYPKGNCPEKVSDADDKKNASCMLVSGSKYCYTDTKDKINNKTCTF